MHTGNVANKSRGDFVSRAEGKLEGAVRAFHYDFRDKTVLDIGSSTGGFTELALKLGAKKVIAVEIGTKQMKAPLRYDPRIELHEKTDIFDCFREGREQFFKGGKDVSGEDKQATIIERPEVIVADVSFVSLLKVLKHVGPNIAGLKTDFLVMLKPQFEAKSHQLLKGVVKNEKIRRDIIKDFEAQLKNFGFIIVNKRDNEVAGKNGNVERFYFLKIGRK
ncbi:TlyA family rRNA (cytidine-2'-O)-methyltransferase [Candidatus Saccharibacteria bacterium]|nr:TlyA family rRNA (cytidine-2'-O)-methyltransferase [Candidatus Saccharibacteria bacterium]